MINFVIFSVLFSILIALLLILLTVYLIDKRLTSLENISKKNKVDKEGKALTNLYVIRKRKKP